MQDFFRFLFRTFFAVLAPHVMCSLQPANADPTVWFARFQSSQLQASHDSCWHQPPNDRLAPASTLQASVSSFAGLLIKLGQGMNLDSTGSHAA